MNRTEDQTALLDAEKATGEEEIEVDGEKISKAEFKDFRNNKEWKAANTQRAQELAAERAALASERQALAEERRLRAAQEADRLEQQQPEDELAGLKDDLKISTDGLPSPVDDEEGFKKGLAERTEQALSRVARKTLEIASSKASQATQDATRAAVSAADVKGLQSQIVAANEAQATQYFKDHPEITSTEQNKIRNRLVRDAEHGTEDPTTRYFRFNEVAFEAADRTVRKEYYDKKAREAGFNEGLSQRERAARAGEHVGGGGSGRTPANTAPIEDIANHLVSLPDGPARTRYLDSLGNRADELIKFQYQQDLEAAGQA